MITAQQVADLYARRLLNAGPEQARMREVQRLVDGDIVVAIPELSQAAKSAVPNRAREGLKQMSQRLASAIPDLICPPVRTTVDSSKLRAYDRRRAILGWWGYSRYNIVLRQRARYLQGYASAPAQIRWNTKLGVPCYEERNPLENFPAHLRSPSDMRPADNIGETHQPLSWLQEHYPAQAAFISKRTTQDGKENRDQLYVILEYWDAEECVLVALGQKDEGVTPVAGSMAVELERYENRTGQCPVVVPRLICLSKLQASLDGMAGMHYTEQLLSGMSIEATRKGVFVDEWLVARPGENPVIEQVPVPTEGIPGIVKGGDLVPRGVDPQFQTNLAIDRLAEAQLVQAGLSAEMQGRAASNIRTGARAQMLLSNVIDFPLQEAQELLQESAQEENRIAVAFAKAYGDGRKSFYVRWDGARGDVTYDPEETFETDENIVRYPLAGADQAGMVISYGQRVQMGTMSKATFMRVDPAVEDPDHEQRQILVESVREAVLSGLQQQAASGELPLIDANEVLLRLAAGDEIEDAIVYAQQKAQERQAAQVPPESPAAQPGLAMPGMGAEAGTAQPQPPMDLASMLAGLRRPQQITGQEQMAAGPAA